MTALSGVIKGVVRRGDAARGALIGDGAAVHDGISFNAATGKTYTKVTGASPTLGTLTSLFTFTGGNQSMYRGASGLLLQSVTNTPRIEFDNGGSCLGLLVEASRTNLIIQSADFSTVDWTKVRTTITADTTTDPAGTTLADKLVEDASAGATHRVQSAGSITVVAASTYTFSCYIKAAGRTRGQLRYAGAADTDGVTIEFDLTAGTASGAANIGTGTGATGGIQAFSNGWYRVLVSGALNGALVLANPRICLEDATGTLAYNGDASSGLFIWGADLELGSFPSSYIPTTTVAVARTADVCTRTLGSEFSATAGTVVVTGRASGGQDAAASQFVWDINDTTANNRIFVNRLAAADTARYNLSAATVGQGPLDGTFTNLTNFKSAVTWATNDLAQSLNGAAIQTDNTATIPAVTQLQLGNELGIVQGNCWIRTFDYYPSRLTNEQLQMRST